MVSSTLTTLSLSCLFLSSFSSAAPIASAPANTNQDAAAQANTLALSIVQAALSLPNSTWNATTSWYLQNNTAGSCNVVSQDTDLVAGLPSAFYNDTKAVSPYCGRYIVAKNPANNQTVTSRIVTGSNSTNLTLSVASWRAINGDGTNMNTTAWRFANETETQAAIAAAAAAASSASVAAAAAAATTSTSAPQNTYVAPTTTTYAAATTTAYTSSSNNNGGNNNDNNGYGSKSGSGNGGGSSSSGGSGTYSGTATYFYQNGQAGACGSVHSDSAYIVAVDSAMYNSGLCGKSLTIYGNGKSVTATVADECPTCASSGSLDLSVAAFNALASESAGVASITWSWN